jgi:hypothetical protein
MTRASTPRRRSEGSSSSTRRVLPSPASPTTDTSQGVDVTPASRTAATSWASSASRPSIGVREPSAILPPGRWRTRSAG